MNPKSSSDVHDHVAATVEAIFTEGSVSSRSDPSRVNFLRVSSFPFCARAWFLNQPNARAVLRSEGAASVFFTSVGTAVHNCFQQAADSLSVPVAFQSNPDEPKSLPKGAVLVQDWVCQECRKRFEFTPHPGKCDWCGSTRIRGDEHEVTFSRRVLGHMDGTFAWPHIPKAPYSKEWHHVPFDYKTCSDSALNTKDALPYPENVDQLVSYGAIKHRQGYNIKKAALVYISRNNPNKRKVVVLRVDGPSQIKKILGYEKAYERAERCRSEKEALTLPVRATEDLERNCQYCKFQKPCGAEQSGDPRHIIPLIRISLSSLKSRKTWPNI